MPGVFWVFGYPLQIFMGNFTFFYLQTVALYNLFQVMFFGKSLLQWFERPFRRLILGWNVFLAALVCTAFLPFNILTSPLLAWVAVQDYYDYKYTISPFFDNIMGLTGEATPQINTISEVEEEE